MGKFLGQYNPTLTEGSRVALPKKIRKHIRGREVVLSKGFDKCIFVYDKNDWVDAARRKVEAPRGEVSTEELERYLYTSATEATVDSQGRIVLPSDLIEFAELTSNTAVLGVGDHVELWDLDNWNAYLERISNKLIVPKE